MRPRYPAPAQAGARDDDPSPLARGRRRVELSRTTASAARALRAAPWRAAPWRRVRRALPEAQASQEAPVLRRARPGAAWLRGASPPAARTLRAARRPEGPKGRPAAVRN